MLFGTAMKKASSFTRRPTTPIGLGGLASAASSKVTRALGGDASPLDGGAYTFRGGNLTSFLPPPLYKRWFGTRAVDFRLLPCVADQEDAVCIVGSDGLPLELSEGTAVVEGSPLECSGGAAVVQSSPATVFRVLPRTLRCW